MAKKRKSWISRFYDYADNQGLRRDGSVSDVARRIKKAGLAKIPDEYFEDQRDLINYLKGLDIAFNKTRGNKGGNNKNKNRKGGKKSHQNKYDPFYDSWAWKKKRYSVLEEYGEYCMNCERGPDEDKICVDHIFPRSKYPHLELDFDNLQVLCNNCNQGKSDTDFTDFRKRARIRRKKAEYGLKPWEPLPLQTLGKYLNL